MKVAEYIIKKLEELGINDFFGLPGDYNFNLLYAVENNPQTNWRGCTNELNAGYAADGYARIKGYGAVITTYGVGELSVVNAIAGSYAENVPVVSLVGVPDTNSINNRTLIHHNFQEVNYDVCFNVFKNVTAKTVFLNKENTKNDIDEALKILVKEKRPVYIAVPIDIAEMDIEDDKVNYDWTSDKDTLNIVVDLIADKINKSKNPVVLGDVLIKRFDAKFEYKEFVEKLNAPVTNFIMGTNLIDMESENYIGSYFSKFSKTKIQEYINETDCLISIGTIYSDLNACGFDIPFDLKSHIAIYGTYTYLEGEKFDNVKMSDILSELSKKIKTKDAKINKPQLGYDASVVLSEKLTSEYIYPRLQEFLKENDIVIAETGIIPHGIAQIKFPTNVDVQFQTLWGSIGWATPATLGVCLAKPNARVILITGDGSHQLTALEMGNIIHLGLKPVIIVLNNDGYTIERILSEKTDDKFNDIMPMNYTKFVRSFGGNIWTTSITTDDEFDKALKITQIMNKLCYLEICTDKMDLPKLTKKMSEFMKKAYNNTHNSSELMINDTECEEENSKSIISEVENIEENQENETSENYDKIQSDIKINEQKNNIENEIDKIIDQIREDEAKFTTKSDGINDFSSKKTIQYGTVVHKSLEE